jgi:membrane protease YdiL (CAAX protease family)
MVVRIDTEELYFRGFLMARFRDLRPTLLIALTSVSFSLWHVLSPSYLLHTFIIGLILGLTVHRTQRLLPAMIAHSLANAAAGLLIIRGFV